jgi:hypothetical protein
MRSMKPNVETKVSDRRAGAGRDPSNLELDGVAKNDGDSRLPTRTW